MPRRGSRPGSPRSCLTSRDSQKTGQSTPSETEGGGSSGPFRGGCWGGLSPVPWAPGERDAVGCFSTCVSPMALPQARGPRPPHPPLLATSWGSPPGGLFWGGVGGGPTSAWTSTGASSRSPRQFREVQGGPPPTTLTCALPHSPHGWRCPLQVVRGTVLPSAPPTPLGKRPEGP